MQRFLQKMHSPVNAVMDVWFQYYYRSMRGEKNHPTHLPQSMQAQILGGDSKAEPIPNID
jgi:hypothetical protein